MKYSIIEEIYYGNRGQGDDVKESKRYRKLSLKCAELVEALNKTMTEEQKNELEKLVENYVGVEAETAMMFYKEGLKTGLLLLSECLDD